MQTKREKVSYCIGLESGRNIATQFKDIDHELLKKGFTDALAGRTPSLDRGEIESILTALQRQIQEQQRAFVEQISEKNMEEGQEFLEENKNKEGVKTFPSGLQYKILASGNGDSPSIHDKVTVHYRGYFIDGTVFDSSYERKEPAEFPVNAVIPGWSEALKKMRVGDKWQLFIPSYLAYGEGGYGPQIQPNMMLIFEMELLKIN